MTEPVEEEYKSGDELAADAESGLEAVLNAWRVPGPSRKLQFRAKKDLAKNWPSLYWAMVRLDEDTPR